jgi:CHAD domain-containing protein
MAFRLKLDEPIEKGFRRIAAEQIQRARAQITACQNPAAEIHEARKCMKRIRALLRLGREGLGDSVFRAENARFRSIAAAMAPARDRTVVQQTLIRLAAACDGATSRAFERLDAALQHPQAPVAGSTPSHVDDLPAQLDRALRQMRRLQISPNTFETIERGLVWNYRRGLRRLDEAFAQGTDEAFHDWRKCVQIHWRHMALLSRAAPPLFEAHIATARELSQILGDDHDLAMLKDRVAALAPDAFSAGDRDTVERVIAAHQTMLRQSAHLRGQMIFAEKPKAHGRRIAAIWKGAIALAELEREADEAKPAKKVATGTALSART